jgi:hypothetical protein
MTGSVDNLISNKSSFLGNISGQTAYWTNARNVVTGSSGGWNSISSSLYSTSGKW